MVTIYIEYKENVDTAKAAEELIAELGQGNIVEADVGFAYIEVDESKDRYLANFMLVVGKDYRIISWDDCDVANAEIDFRSNNG